MGKPIFTARRARVSRILRRHALQIGRIRPTKDPVKIQRPHDEHLLQLVHHLSAMITEIADALTP